MPHNDDSLALMLLCLPMSAEGEPAVKPFTPAETEWLAGRLEAASLSFGSLAGKDVSGVMQLLGVRDEIAYRICILMDRDMLLSRLLEHCLETNTEILTPCDDGYPRRVTARLGRYGSPLLFVKGDTDMLSLSYLAILGIPGVKTPPAIESTIKRLVPISAANGLAIMTGGELGTGRIVRDEVLSGEGLLACVLTGGMEAFAAENANKRALENGNLLLISQPHPLSAPNAIDAAERNRLIYALSSVTAVTATDGKRGEAEAVRRRLCDNLYVYESASLPANAALAGRGFKLLKENELPDLSAARTPDADAEQLSFL